MKFLSLIILILTLGCFRDNQEIANYRTIHLELPIDSSDSLNFTNSIIQKDTIIKSSTKSNILNEPCNEIKEYVLKIEKDGWISDTARLSQVQIYKELNRKDIFFFNDKPFYKLSFKESRLKTKWDYNANFYRKYMDYIDYDLFKNVKSIWGYFYRAKNAKSIITDGVIEQWEFENDTDAQNALMQMQKAGSVIYFNTNPYFIRIRNKLIIFHTRAMAFSYNQKPLFQDFKANISN
jgi:hypothetical protein